MTDATSLSAAEHVLGGVKARGHDTYSTYRPSGAEWLGDVPSHWVNRKITYLFDLIGSGTTPRSDDQSYYDGDVPWVTTSELREKVITSTKSMVTSQAMRDHSSLRLYPEGTLLFAMYGATIGRLAILGIPATVNQACAAFTCPNGVDPKFVYYWLMMRRPVLIALSAGGGQPNLSQDDLKKIRIPTPPIGEQRAIAAFLDERTRRIDELIEARRKLLKLLAEKRQAVITHAVTKGLDPNVKLKPSGIDWLGDVPASWTRRRLGDLATIRGGGTPNKNKDEYWDGDIPWVSPKDMKRPFIEDSEDHITALALADTTLELFEPPVVLMVVRGMILAHSFPVATTRVPVTVNQDMKALRASKAVTARYLAYLLAGLKDVMFKVIEESAHGTRVLRMDLWKSMTVYLPDPDEQEPICDQIDTSLATIDNPIVATTRALKRLRELRDATISAAVTGKIDVRGEVAR